MGVAISASLENRIISGCTYAGVLVTGVYYTVVASVASWQIILFIGLVFAISMASVACEAEANRRRAEQLLDDLAVSHQKLKAYANISRSNIYAFCTAHEIMNGFPTFAYFIHGTSDDETIFSA